MVKCCYCHGQIVSGQFPNEEDSPAQYCSYRCHVLDHLHMAYFSMVVMQREAKLGNRLETFQKLQTVINAINRNLSKIGGMVSIN